MTEPVDLEALLGELLDFRAETAAELARRHDKRLLPRDALLRFHAMHAAVLAALVDEPDLARDLLPPPRLRVIYFWADLHPHARRAALVLHLLLARQASVRKGIAGFALEEERWGKR